MSLLFLLLTCAFSLGSGQAQAAGLGPKESADLRDAKQLYKSGKYEEAANIFSRLSAAHPDMPTFSRNAGAAYYYLRKADPALSNLREYLRMQKNISADDRQEVEKWIAEMEQVRAQSPILAGTAQTPPPVQPGAAPVGSAPMENSPVAPAGPSANAVAPPGQPPAPLPGQTGSPPPAAGYLFQGYAPYPGPPAQAQAPAQTQPPTQAPAQFQAPPAYPGGPVYPQPADQSAFQGQGQVPPGSAPTAQPYAYPYPPQNANPYPVQPQPQSAQGMVASDSSQTAKESNALPWIIGGAGVGTIALGGVFTYLYRSAFSDTQKQYDPGKESDGKTYSVLQFVCYGIGAAGVVTAIILARSESSAPKGSSVTILPAVGPRVAGAALNITY